MVVAPEVARLLKVQAINSLHKRASAIKLALLQAARSLTVNGIILQVQTGSVIYLNNNVSSLSHNKNKKSLCRIKLHVNTASTAKTTSEANATTSILTSKIQRKINLLL